MHTKNMRQNLHDNYENTSRKLKDGPMYEISKFSNVTTTHKGDITSPKSRPTNAIESSAFDVNNSKFQELNYSASPHYDMTQINNAAQNSSRDNLAIKNLQSRSINSMNDNTKDKKKTIKSKIRIFSSDLLDPFEF